MIPLPMQMFIEPVVYRREEVAIEGESLATDLEQLCAQAQIRLRATAPRRRVVIYPGQKQIRTPNVDYVGVPVTDLHSQDAALRALEALAHSFFDHAARACVCGRGLFTGNEVVEEAPPGRGVERIMPTHRTFRGSTPPGGDRPDVSLLDDVVAPKILDAMAIASKELAKTGVRFALAGALAVGAHGHPRATKDVDFLVGPEAFCVHPSGIVTIMPGVPIAVGNVAVDPMSIDPGEEFLIQAIEQAAISEGIPVLPAPALVYTKLKSPRKKDEADIVELVHSGLDVDEVRAYLAQHAPRFVPKFEALVERAEEEER